MQEIVSYCVELIDGETSLVAVDRGMIKIVKALLAVKGISAAIEYMANIGNPMTKLLASCYVEIAITKASLKSW